MKAALLPERGVVKVAGEDARKFLNGLLTTDIEKVTPQKAAFAALLTPQGKIMVDMIVAENPAADGGGYFLDVPRALAPTLVQRLNFYRLRANVIVEDLSEVLGVMALWDGADESDYGLSYADPRIAALGSRCMLPPHLVADAAADLGAAPVEASEYEAHRIALGRRAAASISTTATPSRMKPTWTSSMASISRRAATSARKWSRASNIAAPRASASCRSHSRISRPRPACA